MTLNLIRRLVKGEPLTATDHDGNLDKLENGIEARPTTAEQSAAIAAAVAAHVAAADPHEGYLTPAEGDAAYVGLGDARLSDTRTPTAHKSSHATGGADALTPADIGAATSAQGDLADSAVQPGDLAAVATSGAYGDLSGRPTLGTAAALDIGTTAGTVAAGDDARLSDARTPTAHKSSHATGGADALTPGDIGAATSAQGSLADSAVQPGDLAAVATSGAYGDLSGTPGLVSTTTAGLQPATGFGTITYAATVNLDLAALNGQVNEIILTGALELTASNLAKGRQTGLLLDPGASERTITFPVDWRPVGVKPATIPANKLARLTLECWGTNASDVLFAIAIQP